MHRSFLVPAFPWCPPRHQLPQAEVLRQDGVGGPLCQGMQGWILLPAPRAIVMFVMLFFQSHCYVCRPAPHPALSPLPWRARASLCCCGRWIFCVWNSTLCSLCYLWALCSSQAAVVPWPGAEPWGTSPSSCPWLSHLLSHPVLPPCCMGSSFCMAQCIVISASSFQTQT